MNTYHIYWKDKPIFKNLDEEDFQEIWTKILSTYNDELNYQKCDDCHCTTSDILESSY